MSTAARKQAFNRGSKNAPWRGKAIAAIHVCSKQMFDSKDERNVWIASFLKMRAVAVDTLSLTDLTDDQLGAVAGEMKRLTGTAVSRRRLSEPGAIATGSNVITHDFGSPSATDPVATASGSDIGGDVVHLASQEQAYTIEKLLAHIGWDEAAKFNYLIQRFKAGTPRQLTFANATKATTALLRIAAHQDLKKTRPAGTPVGRKEMDKFIPKLKAQLKIDQ